MIKKPIKDKFFEMPKLTDALILGMLSLCLAFLWDLKEWKGKKDQVDEEQTEKIAFLRADFGQLDGKQQTTTDRVTYVEALLPDGGAQRKKKK